MNVIEAWLADLRTALHGEPAAVSDVRIGVFYTAVALGTGETGGAFTPRDQADTGGCPRPAPAGPPARARARAESVLSTAPPTARRSELVSAASRASAQASCPASRPAWGAAAAERGQHTVSA